MLFNSLKAKIADWQCLTSGNPFIDLLKFLIGSSDVDFRKKKFLI
jgi:hypothetical protein